MVDDPNGNDTGVPSPHDWREGTAFGRLAKSENDVNDNWLIDSVSYDL